MSDLRYESTQKARAVKQYVECGKPSCEKFPHDYKLGWLDGFYTVSTGGPECPPAVAPARYWNVKQQLEHCDARRRSYYSGWQDGAARAIQFPDTHHLKIFETCECTVPRCELPCVGGSCGPCSASVIGSPVHEELIEAPENYHYESVEPLVPPAPSAPFDSEDGDQIEEEEESAGDGSETSTTSEAPSDQDVSIVSPEPVEEIATEELDQGQITAVGRTKLVRDHDAHSLFGSAFDLTSSRHSMVKHQAKDPVALIVERDSSSGGLPSIEAAISEPTSTPIVIESGQGDGFVKPVTPPTISAVDETVVKVKADIEQVQPRVVVPKPKIKRVDSAPVKRAETLHLTKDGRLMPNATIPVAFEMIESTTETIQLAK